jgi:hypothetical protein
VRLRKFIAEAAGKMTLGKIRAKYQIDQFTNF